jgi:hypothetical protein
VGVAMRIALCNEVIAPYTLSDEPHRLSAARIAAARAIGYIRGILEAIEGN